MHHDARHGLRQAARMDDINDDELFLDAVDTIVLDMLRRTLFSCILSGQRVWLPARAVHRAADHLRPIPMTHDVGSSVGQRGLQSPYCTCAGTGDASDSRFANCSASHWNHSPIVSRPV